jgi:hypothetical protein
VQLVFTYVPLAGSSYAALAATFLQHWQQTSPSTGIMHSRSRGSKHPAALTQQASGMLAASIHIALVIIILAALAVNIDRAGSNHFRSTGSKHSSSIGNKYSHSSWNKHSRSTDGKEFCSIGIQ